MNGLQWTAEADIKTKGRRSTAATPFFLPMVAAAQPFFTLGMKI
jgi:hypothetical protein